MDYSITDMQQAARNDQATTELQDTACRVGAYFRVLLANGVPVGQASMMSATYNTLILARHFNVDMFGMPMSAFDATEDDDDV